MFGSSSWMSQSRLRPSRTRAAGQHRALAGADEHRALARVRRGRAGPARPRVLARRVDHRVAEVGLLRLGVLVLGRLDQHRLDAELADAQAVVGREVDGRARRQRQALVARVLEQVVGQLLARGVLPALELLAVLRRQVDRVLVRHVRARDRDGLVVAHLLRELARDLDRLDLGLEGLREGALEEALELLFDSAQQAHDVRHPRRDALLVARRRNEPGTRRGHRHEHAEHGPGDRAARVVERHVARHQLRQARCGRRPGRPPRCAAPSDVEDERAAAHEQRQQRRRRRPRRRSAAARSRRSSGTARRSRPRSATPPRRRAARRRSGAPNSRSLPVTTSAMTSHQRPAAAAPARRQGVGASAGDGDVQRRDAGGAEQRRERGQRPPAGRRAA